LCDLDRQNHSLRTNYCILKFEHSRLSNRLPPGGDTRRLSDLNITIEPPSLDNEVNLDSGLKEEDEDTENRLYPTNSHISDASSESYGNDTHIASWIEGSLIGSSIFNKEDEEDNKSDSS
jgi:hypothetical protein